MRNGNMQQSGFGEVSVVSADVIKKLRHRKHMLLSTDYWRKHFEKWPRLPCVGSDGNMSKGHDPLFASAC